MLPAQILRSLNTDVGRYLGVLMLFAGVIGAVLSLVYFQVSLEIDAPQDVLKATLWTVFFILTIIAGVAAWLFVLAQESRRVAEEETRRQTDLLMNEIEAHQRTDAKLQKAKEVAESANKAKSRHVVALATNCARRSMPSWATRSSWSGTPRSRRPRSTRSRSCAAAPSTCRD